MTERRLCKIQANVMVYHDIEKRWFHAGNINNNTFEPGSPSISIVSILTNEHNNQHRIVAQKMDNTRDVTVNMMILKSLKYHVATPTFHQWRDGKTVYGLNFHDEESGNNFSNILYNILENLKQESTLNQAPPMLHNKQNNSQIQRNLSNVQRNVNGNLHHLSGGHLPNSHNMMVNGHQPLTNGYSNGHSTGYANSNSSSNNSNHSQDNAHLGLTSQQAGMLTRSQQLQAENEKLQQELNRLAALQNQQQQNYLNSQEKVEVDTSGKHLVEDGNNMGNAPINAKLIQATATGPPKVPAVPQPTQNVPVPNGAPPPPGPPPPVPGGAPPPPPPGPPPPGISNLNKNNRSNGLQEALNKAKLKPTSTGSTSNSNIKSQSQIVSNSSVSNSGGGDFMSELRKKLDKKKDTVEKSEVQNSQGNNNNNNSNTISHSSHNNTLNHNNNIFAQPDTISRHTIHGKSDIKSKSQNMTGILNNPTSQTISGRTSPSKLSLANNNYLNNENFNNNNSNSNNHTHSHSNNMEKQSSTSSHSLNQRAPSNNSINKSTSSKSLSKSENNQMSSLEVKNSHDYTKMKEELKKEICEEMRLVIREELASLMSRLGK